jgi:hypothetical protein
VFRRGTDRPYNWRIAIAGCLGALIAAAACGGPQPGPQPKAATPVPSPSAAAQGSLADWQKVGATEAPPGTLRQVALGATQVVNETNGAVSDADARAWAEGFLRAYGYLQWAVTRGQDQFLIRGGLSAAPLSVLRPNLNDILAGRQANGHIEYSPQTFRRLVVRQAPQSLQKLYTGVQFVWTQYAIYLDAVGPASTTVVDAAGNRKVKAAVAAGAPEFELVGGQLSHDPLMGDVWMLDADFDCLAPSTRQGVAPLCNP